MSLKNRDISNPCLGFNLAEWLQAAYFYNVIYNMLIGINAKERDP